MHSQAVGLLLGTLYRRTQVGQTRKTGYHAGPLQMSEEQVRKRVNNEITF